jgi:group II intron reverse transcriptase/maturase
MQTANHILQAIRKLGEKRIPLTRVYRALFSEDLFLTAYGKLYRNQGALTPGTDNDTMDGMSRQRIQNIIEALRDERFRFHPARRIRIAKKSGGTRPLGIPNFTDKLVQEVIRMLLEAYYEPRFRNSSHGFRPERGCHTALTDIKQKFRGSSWFIEGDIRGCFDNIDHTVLMNILARDIHDGRLLNLIRMSLEAGVLEAWTYQATYSGTPQGGVLSPLLSNIVLNELDSFIEDTLIPQHTRGKHKAENPEYRRLRHRISKARRLNDIPTLTALQRQRRQLPYGVPNDATFRRLTYVRYADDFILGFIGPKSEAERIKASIGTFLRDALHLDMSPTKTLITHARTEHAKFLGYAISTYHADDKVARIGNTSRKGRSVNGHIRLGLPFGLIDEKAQRYLRNGQVINDPTLIDHTDAHIIDTFQRRFVGLAEYYKYAVDRCHLNKLQYLMTIALVKTLASKYKLTAERVYRKYRGTLQIGNHTYRTLEVNVPTTKGTVVIRWGAIPLNVVRIGYETLNDTLGFAREYARTDLVQRLQANICELCGSTQHIEVHHVRKLQNLKQRWAGKRDKPKWVVRMIALQRKSLVVCAPCHADIHAGRPTPIRRE